MGDLEARKVLGMFFKHIWHVVVETAALTIRQNFVGNKIFCSKDIFVSFTETGLVIVAKYCEDDLYGMIG